MDFSPSTGNYCVIRLLEEAGGVEDPENVITLRFGGRSGSDDALEATFRSGGKDWKENSTVPPGPWAANPP